MWDRSLQDHWKTFFRYEVWPEAVEMALAEAEAREAAEPVAAAAAAVWR